MCRLGGLAFESAPRRFALAGRELTGSEGRKGKREGKKGTRKWKVSSYNHVKKYGENAPIFILFLPSCLFHFRAGKSLFVPCPPLPPSQLLTMEEELSI